MKVQVPGEDAIEGCRALSRLFDEPIKKRDYHLGFRDAIDYINEQLANAPPTKRPFLSDDEIGDELSGWNYALNPMTAKASVAGAKWARDKYESAFVADVSNVAPKWQPVVGDKCAFWLNDWNVTEAFTFKETSGDHFKSKETNLYYTHCAALESLDEIGKPPSYFIDRGRSTV